MTDGLTARQRAQRDAAQTKSAAAPEVTPVDPLAYVAELPPAEYAEWLADQQPITWTAWRALPLKVRLRIANTEGVAYRFPGALGKGAAQ
ncbi:hypothetical protein ACJWDR_29215 [Streptomyces tauricus]|uniref:hypothetical protein n=1 Tax=Streptomyces tauricus TaxID=68274 RepID=UPI00387EEB26